MQVDQMTMYELMDRAAPMDKILLRMVVKKIMLNDCSFVSFFNDLADEYRKYEEEMLLIVGAAKLNLTENQL